MDNVEDITVDVDEDGYLLTLEGDFTSAVADYIATDGRYGIRLKIIDRNVATKLVTELIFYLQP